MYEGIGGVTELYKNRVVIPFDASNKEFKHVIHHELVHAFINDYNFFDSFNLYLGIDELIDLFSDKYFLILFWLHFIAINLFCASWMVKDSQKLGVSKIIIFTPLLLTYFIGPVGLFIYWIVRVFAAKRLSLYE